MKTLKEIIRHSGPVEIVALVLFVGMVLIWAAILPEFLRCGC
jgi:hypothetical protein